MLRDLEENIPPRESISSIFSIRFTASYSRYIIRIRYIGGDFIMQISELKEFNPNETTVYCPLLEKEIDDADCYEIVHCGLGDIKKKLHPEITDWDKAIPICAKCGRN